MPTRFGVAAMGSGPARTWIVNENCEGTGTPSGWSNVSGVPQINWDYSAAPLADSQSLYLTVAAAIGLTRIDFTDMSEIYVYFLVKLTNGSAPAGTRTLFGIGANGGATVQTFAITTALRFTFGFTPTTVLTVDTVYHVWLHYIQGTGANATTEMGFSTNGVRPTSGTANYGIATNGSATNLAGRLNVGTGATNTNVDVVFDNIKVSSTLIGDNGT